MKLSTTLLWSLLAIGVTADQCYETVNRILATENVLSATTVLTQLEFTQQGLSSGAVSVDGAIASRCAGVTDPEVAQFCTGLQTAQGRTLVTQATVGTLNLLINCVQVFINRGPDYTLAAESFYPFDGSVTPPNPNPQPSQHVGGGGIRKRTSVFKTLAMADKKLDFSTCPLKSDFGALTVSTKRQQRECQTAFDCYTTCLSCGARDYLCSAGGTRARETLCAALGGGAGVILSQVALNLACIPLSSVCGPAAVACFNGCLRVLPNSPLSPFLSTIVGAAVTGACAFAVDAGCNFALSQCNSCNAQNNNICDPNTARCCPSETGTRCGVDCCCCGAGLAPRGQFCECVPTP